MPRTAPKNQPSKFARYRERKRAEGKKLLRMWVLDPNAPGFAERMKEEADRLAASETKKRSCAGSRRSPLISICRPMARCS
jgi:Protein  of unknown function (DUF3018)